MEDDIENKFTRTDELKQRAEAERERLNYLKKFLGEYKAGLSK
jgi:hypothetical protein